MSISEVENAKQLSICGYNDGQHLYLHYDSWESVSVFLSLTNAESYFDIVPTFIECNSQNPQQAPAGCTQYFPASSGEVKSFNGDTRSRQGQINSQLYSVCVGSHPGANEIRWTPCSANPFCISGVYGGESRTGDACFTDYVDIPGSPNGRYCGCGFPSAVTSRSQPFSLYVNFDDGEFPNVPETNPETGCPFGFDCIDGFGFPIIIGSGPTCNSPEGIALFLQCVAPASFLDYIDSGNTGFCLRYSVI